MATYIQGNEVFIYLNESASSASFTVVACTKSDVFNIENEFLEITQTAQKETAFLPTFQNATMSIEQAYISDTNGSQQSTYQLREWAHNQTLLYFIFALPDSTVTGSCYIKSGSISGGVNTGALANFELIVTGATILTEV
jgi:hypothetical protein